MTGSTQSQTSILREVQEAGRDPSDGSLELLVGYANCPDPEIRTEAIESLGRLDTAEAHQWIVALAASETDDTVRHSICRAAGYWTLRPLHSLIEQWVRSEESSQQLRHEGIAALIAMQAKDSLTALEDEIALMREPALDTAVHGVLDSADVQLENGDRLARETNTALWTWKLWHADGTVTRALDDGSVLGPDFRKYNPWTADWWPADARREGRLNLRRDILALTEMEPQALRFVLEMALQTPAAASLLHTAIPWVDEPDDLLIPLLEHPDALLRASAWEAAAAFGTVELRTRSVHHLENELVPSVRHMMLTALRGEDSEASVRLLCDSMAANDHVERAVACDIASLVGGPEVVQALRQVTLADLSAVCRDTAARAIAKVEGHAK